MNIPSSWCGGTAELQIPENSSTSVFYMSWFVSSSMWLSVRSLHEEPQGFTLLCHRCGQTSCLVGSGACLLSLTRSRKIFPRSFWCRKLLIFFSEKKNESRKLRHGRPTWHYYTGDCDFYSWEILPDHCPSYCTIGNSSRWTSPSFHKPHSPPVPGYRTCQLRRYRRELS
jgi:hypothetical protein